METQMRSKVATAALAAVFAYDRQSDSTLGVATYKVGDRNSSLGS
jgi:hypothetical protein